MSVTKLHRGKIRMDYPELHTTRLIGAGWTWDCSCGDKGSWHNQRAEALAAAAHHKMFAHGER
jgi:hypothetical protein